MKHPLQFKKLISSIQENQNSLPDDNRIAVFDADGTLWPEDIGFGFFKYQVKKKVIPDILVNYKKKPKTVCSLMVQNNKGVFFKQYLKWCRDYLKTKPLKVFDFQKKLIEVLRNFNTKIYVVSASCEWLVQESLRYYKIPVDQVIGVKTQIKEGKITDKLIHPLPVGEGKVKAFLEKSQNKPFFVSGNTLSDLELLNLSKCIKWVVALAKKEERQYENEQALLILAQKKNWFYVDHL